MIPKISVIITSYNQKGLLKEAIDSVIFQTLKPWEIILVDDCSTDDSQETILEYQKAHGKLIKAYLQPENMGIGKTRAFGQKKAAGDWLTYLDGDDRFLPTKLEREWEALQKNPAARVAYSDFYYIDSEGNRLRRWNTGDELPAGQIFEEVYRRDFPRGILFRNELISKECIDTIGYYNTDLVAYEDWDFKIRLSDRFEIVACNEPQIEYRVHSGGISSYLAKRKLLEAFVQVFEQNKYLLEHVHPKQKLKVLESMEADITRRVLDIARRSVEIPENSSGQSFELGSFMQYLSSFNRIKLFFNLHILPKQKS